MPSMSMLMTMKNSAPALFCIPSLPDPRLLNSRIIITMNTNNCINLTLVIIGFRAVFLTERWANSLNCCP